MQEQNFENEVRHKMDALNLEPSPPVWQNIEAQLRKKRDRKRFLFWWLPFLIISAGICGAIYLQQPVEKNSTANTESILVKKSTAPETGSKEITTSNEKKQLIKHKVTPEAKTGAKENFNLAKNKSRIHKTGITRYQNQAADVVKTIQKNTTDLKSLEKNFNLIAAEVSTEKSKQQTAQGSPTAIATTIEKIKNSSDTLNKAVKTAPDLKDSTGKKTAQKRKEKRWEWNLSAQAGLSNTTSALFKTTPVFAQDVSNAPANSPGSFAAPPLPTQKSFATVLGAGIKRKITNRLALTTALQYGFYSTKNKVGIISDSSANIRYSATDSLKVAGYYTTGQQQEIKNRYHFIELPIGIELALHKRAPLVLTTGFAVTQLIQTNALLYNAANRIYYKDKTAYDKTGLYFYTGLQYGFYKNKKLTLQTGPHLQYGLKKLEQKTGNQQRFFSAGIKTTISF